MTHLLKGSLLGSAMAGAAALASLAVLPTQAVQAQNGAVKPGSEIVLSIGRGQLVSLPTGMADLFIANEEVADVQVKSARQLYVFGKSGGETTLYASNSAGDVIYSATVRVGSNIDSVSQMLTLAMPDSRISVATMNGLVLLTGVVASPDDSAEAERLAQAYVGENVRVISRLRTATPLQVNLQVRFAEVSRTLVKEIGTNLLTRDQTGGFLFGVTRGRNIGSIGPTDLSGFPELDASSLFGLPAGSIDLPFNPATGQFITGPGTQYTFNNSIASSGSTALQFAGKLFGVDIASALDLSEQLGLITTLSQPNLTALSGETADFLAGGEFPIPISQGLGTTTIEYRNYGVSLAYTPTVLANGRISMRVRPEVSELSAAGAVTLNGFQVPALTIRRAETTVELGSGQSFMIAGLLSNTSQNTLTKAPGLGDVPILGNLFKSTAYQKGETELVIIVTPYLVEPVDGSDIKLPTDGFESPSDAQRFLLNQQNDGTSGAVRPGATVETPTENNPDFGSIAPDNKAVPSRSPAEKKSKKAVKTAQAPDGAPGFSFE